MEPVDTTRTPYSGMDLSTVLLAGPSPLSGTSPGPLPHSIQSPDSFLSKNWGTPRHPLTHPTPEIVPSQPWTNLASGETNGTGAPVRPLTPFDYDTRSTLF